MCKVDTILFILTLSQTISYILSYTLSQIIPYTLFSRTPFRSHILAFHTISPLIQTLSPLSHITLTLSRPRSPLSLSLPLIPGGGPSFVARVAEQFEARCKEMHQEVCVAYDQICENALKTAERQGLPLLQGMSLSR